MQIDRILFPVTTLGPGNRLVIWTIGCPHRCYNCSNPELWEENKHKDILLESISIPLKEKVGLADGVTITGGEPFYQPAELYLLIKMLRQLGYYDILVYTGYDYAYIKERFPHILSQIDVLVDGRYEDNLNNNIGLKGSLNQECIIMNSKLKSKYCDFNIKLRERQNFVSNDKIISVGIPINDEKN